MNTLDFLNSKDISKYLEQIDYNFSPEQSVYIIYDSHKHSVKQKQAAWEELASTNPDYILKQRRRDLPDLLLREFSQRYIAIQNKLLEECKTGKGVYSYKYLTVDDGYWIDDDGFYDSFANCFKAVKEEFNDDELLKIRITKSYFNEGERSREITIELLPDGEVWDIDANYLSKKEDDIFRYFEWMWLDIPTPFKRGDMVKVVSEPCSRKLDEWEDVFVLTDIVNWDSKKLKENSYVNGKDKYNRIDFRWRNQHIYRLKESGDISDMYTSGYGILNDGEVFYDCWHTYLNLEYYRKDTDGELGILKAISSFEKGDISTDLLINACNIIRQTEVLKSASTCLDCYTDDAKKLAGLK